MFLNKIYKKLVKFINFWRTLNIKMINLMKYFAIKNQYFYYFVIKK